MAMSDWTHPRQDIKAFSNQTVPDHRFFLIDRFSYKKGTSTIMPSSEEIQKKN
jgi:hypothetical protein